MRRLVFLAIALPGISVAQNLPPIHADLAPPRVDNTLARPDPHPVKPYPKASETPVCECPDQCAAMWAAAPDELEKASGMRLKLATDTLLDTYAPSGFQGLHGRAVKRPGEHGKYEISASFDGAYNAPVEDVDLKRARTLFNMGMHIVQMSNECPSA